MKYLLSALVTLLLSINQVEAVNLSILKQKAQTAVDTERAAAAAEAARVAAAAAAARAADAAARAAALLQGQIDATLLLTGLDPAFRPSVEAVGEFYTPVTWAALDAQAQATYLGKVIDHRRGLAGLGAPKDNGFYYTVGALVELERNGVAVTDEMIAALNASVVAQAGADPAAVGYDLPNYVYHSIMEGLAGNIPVAIIKVVGRRAHAANPDAVVFTVLHAVTPGRINFGHVFGGNMADGNPAPANSYRAKADQFGALGMAADDYYIVTGDITQNVAQGHFTDLAGVVAHP